MIGGSIMKPKPICNICHTKPSEYDKVNHCRRCHRAYCRARYEDACIRTLLALKRNGVVRS